MTVIQLYVLETPVLTFQKASLSLLGETHTVEVNNSYRSTEREELFQELENACIQLIKKGYELLESIGETEDFIDFIYINYENGLASPTLEQLLQFPFTKVNKLLTSVFQEVADVVTDKFFEELTNRLEEVTDDELVMEAHLGEEELQLEVLLPKAFSETVNLEQLMVDYQGTLEEVTRWFLEALM
ncbi:hypothetical protein [Enterococcus sp. AZ109]|uniref:hypothetical protein n=1 Tax=Enterococcus sp. AZ109 TaxID=2774634 RepID=UPI003F25FC1B